MEYQTFNEDTPLLKEDESHGLFRSNNWYDSVLSLSEADTISVRKRSCEKKRVLNECNEKWKRQENKKKRGLISDHFQ